MKIRLLSSRRAVAAHGSTPDEGKNAIMQLLAFLGTSQWTHATLQKLFPSLTRQSDWRRMARHWD